MMKKTLFATVLLMTVMPIAALAAPSVVTLTKQPNCTQWNCTYQLQLSDDASGYKIDRSIVTSITSNGSGISLSTLQEIWGNGNDVIFQFGDASLDPSNAPASVSAMIDLTKAVSVPTPPNAN